MNLHCRYSDIALILKYDCHKPDIAYIFHDTYKLCCIFSSNSWFVLKYIVWYVHARTLEIDKLEALCLKVVPYKVVEVVPW